MRPPLPEGPFLVVGLKRSGLAAARTLAARGEEVIAVDAGLPDIEGLDGVEVHTASEGLELLDRAGAVVKSPGVPAQAAVIAAARERGVAVLGELELGWRLLDREFIAVTGTNGKTTTVELLGHLHRRAGVPVAVAGNVGTAVTGLEVEPGGVVVCETSSFQLEDTVAFAPEAAILLNVEADHLDRHGTLAQYTTAKLEAFVRQGPGDVAVLPEGFPDPAGRALRVRFGPGGELDDRDGALWWRGERLIAHAQLALRGAHNAQNAAAAAAACLARDMDPEAVRAGLATFAGVAHRLEEIARRDGVLYVNDSKATNVASTLVALASFDAPVHLILGGQGKGQDFAPLRAPVARRCADAYLIGEDAGRIGEAIATGRPSGDLEGAVAAARAAAAPGEVVLLSPACASFDQFADFEARGEAFRALVSN
ncbi:MAG: UDP-N-acetylmuramoyl-L-alanine--D-glutamate ligase [Solirubrobacteraceae bacterium MAG38_C4-C5]|nr:UDP-N-acetylmuramoyl-L-alanine--D-glutamate ligase [Candidatus Siliceabacter maunaloa]